MLSKSISQLKVVRQCVSKRNLSIHEFRSAALLKSYGVGVPRGEAATTPEQAYQCAKDLNTNEMVLKAQALTGGRGKGHFDNGLKSGVRLVETPEQVKELSEKMLNHKLITKQTGEQGKIVTAVYVVERKYALQEAYLSIVMDRKNQSTMIIASSEGGMDIEGVAKKTDRKSVV